MTLPDGWIERRLGEICHIEIGGTPSRNVPVYWDTEQEASNPWVSIKDMRSRYITETAERITDAGVRHSNVKAQPPGTILLSFKLTIGRVSVAGVPLYTNEAIAALQPHHLCPDYLFFALQHWDLLKDVDQAIKGATLNKEKLKRIVCDFPESVEEQATIAEVLSTVDRAIECTEALTAKYERIEAGLMQDLLSRGIDDTGHCRSESTHEFKGSPIGRIPVDWKVTTLAAITDELITYGIVQAGPHVENGVPYVRTGDMAGDRIDATTLLRTSPRIAQSYQRATIFAGDIVFALRATVGKVLPVGPELEGANLTQGTAKISPNASTDPTFLLWALRSSSVQDRIRLEQKGTTFMEITLGDLRKIELAVPSSLVEQRRIGAAFSALELVSSSHFATLVKLKSLRASLMQDLLTGKRRVMSLPNDA